MYQIKYTSGLEIQVRGNLCSVVDWEHNERYCGTYEACHAWLTARACREIGTELLVPTSTQ